MQKDEKAVPRDHRVIRARQAEGRHIPHVYDCGHGWTKYDSNVRVPGSDKLFNFDMPLGKKGAILVLDNYGDEVLPSRIRRQIMNDKMFANTIGIHRKTGEIVNVGFIEEYIADLSEEGTTTKTAGTFWSFGTGGVGERLFVPKSHLRRLDELKSKKRPFNLSVFERTVFEFMTRWASYAELQRDLVVELEFDGRSLQVWGDNCREVSRWQDVPTHPNRLKER